MATQAVLIADTITGMKRAVARSRDSVLSSDSEDSIDRFTNRGNKLKRKARYVHEGQLDRPNGPKVYKRKIEHAGYHRNVISQNPRRHDDNGDKLDEDEEDEEADAAAAEANPYNGILLHELLAPLTSAADLSTHPSLSVSYTSPILSNMLQDASEMIQRERNTIRGAKLLLTKLRGDEVWIPCSSLDSGIGDVIFDTTKVYEEIVRSRPTPTLAKKKNEAPTNGSPPFTTHHNEGGTTKDSEKLSHELQDVTTASALPSKEVMTADEPTEPASLSYTLGDTDLDQGKVNGIHVETNGDTTARHDFELRGGSLADTNGSADFVSKNKDRIKSPVSDDSGQPSIESTERIEAAGDSTSRGVQHRDANQPDIAATTNPKDDEMQDVAVALSVEDKEDVPMEAEPPAIIDDLQPIPHRMRTRAQAQAVSDNATSLRTRSPSVASSFVPSIHPLFFIPAEACPDRDFGLPADEAEATRRILMSYVQKQEEVCRGAEKLYNGLLQAKRMKMDVFNSCKAEEHVGEMSDGEDWYDKAEWGLEEDLRKGHDEEDDDVGIQHKKTRARRG